MLARKQRNICVPKAEECVETDENVQIKTSLPLQLTVDSSVPICCLFNEKINVETGHRTSWAFIGHD
jgi:hypothetical protein